MERRNRLMALGWFLACVLLSPTLWGAETQNDRELVNEGRHLGFMAPDARDAQALPRLLAKTHLGMLGNPNNLTALQIGYFHEKVVFVANFATRPTGDQPDPSRQTIAVFRWKNPDKAFATQQSGWLVETGDAWALAYRPHLSVVGGLAPFLEQAEIAVRNAMMAHKD